jgi:transglutaminase 1
MPVKFDDYYSKLVDQCNFKMSCLCRVIETNQVFAEQDDFVLLKPNLTLKVRVVIYLHIEMHLSCFGI